MSSRCNLINNVPCIDNDGSYDEFGYEQVNVIGAMMP